ncbi:unnamed protein product [Durusdinium trenchii]|uniref:HMA domain-containing protein n=1 Tax=Durusdinium trenchii TaxID=1381693 RepID=A0ABP0QP25_9DINO
MTDGQAQPADDGTGEELQEKDLNVSIPPPPEAQHDRPARKRANKTKTSFIQESDDCTAGEELQQADVNVSLPLPPDADHDRPARKRPDKTKTSFMQDFCACCTHTEQVDDLNPTVIGECLEHLAIKTRFSIRNICCDSEVRLIERIVTPLPGVESVSINTFQKICIAVHCPSCTTPDSIVEKLNRSGLGAALLGQGNMEINPEAPSLRDMFHRHSRQVLVVVSALLLTMGLVGSGEVLLLLALVVGLLAILRESLVTLRKGQIDISTLVVLASLAAAMQGERADSALVVLLFNISKVVESVALNRVSSALRAVLQLQAVHTVHLVEGKAVPVSELKPGDEIALRPGEECPADGLVSKGSASCSEAALSGESRPVHKQKGDLISSGAVILNGYLEVTLTTASSQSALSLIEAQVEEAQMKRTDKHLMIQRFARLWTPSIIFAVLVICILIPLLTNGDFQTWSHRGLVVLLTACPCAIVIGAPLATTCAIAAAASHGLLIKRPETVEKLPHIAAVGLDKTGTLTKGELSVLAAEKLGDPNLEEEVVLKWAAALELRSSHPIAAAIVSKALGCVGEALEYTDLPEVTNFRVLPGVGIQGFVPSKTGSSKVILGNKRALDVANADPSDHSRFIAFQEKYHHHTAVAIMIDGKLQFGLALNDTIRQEAAKMVEDFKTIGFKPAMLTGDTAEAGAFVAQSLGLDDELCRFAMTPDQKHEWVASSESEGRHVLILGDGINDATALAAAHVGVAIGETGAALAAQSADIVMMTDKLYRLPQCVLLCRYALRIERLNIAIPCIVKLLQAGIAMAMDIKLWIVVVADLGTLLLALLLGISVLSPAFWQSVAMPVHKPQPKSLETSLSAPSLGPWAEGDATRVKDHSASKWDNVEFHEMPVWVKVPSGYSDPSYSPIPEYFEPWAQDFARHEMNAGYGQCLEDSALWEPWCWRFASCCSH